MKIIRWIQRVLNRRKVPWILPIVTEQTVWNAKDAEALRLFLNSESGGKLLNSLYVTVYEMNLSPRPTDDISRGRIQGMAIAINVILGGCSQLPEMYEAAIDEAEKDDDILGTSLDQLNLNS